MSNKAFSFFRQGVSSLFPAGVGRRFVDRLRRLAGLRQKSGKKALFGLGGALCLLAGYGLFGPGLLPGGPHGPYVKLPVSLTYVQAADFPLGLNTSFPLAPAGARPSAWPAPGRGGSFVRGEAVRHLGEVSFPDMDAGAPDSGRHGLVSFSRGRVRINTADGAVVLGMLRYSPVPLQPDASPLEADMFTPASFAQAVTPALYGETLDEGGRPLRWSGGHDAGASGFQVCLAPRRTSTDVIRRLIQGLGILAGEARYSAQAARYRDHVARYAAKYNLAASLVLAIMHTESDFNPYAVSQSSAVGLMQIVPDTAGNEVYRYLMGTQGTPSLDTLFSPEHNIKYGAVYLHLLSGRYFGRVTNPASRQMCMIAAYNGGPGAVQRLFGPTPEAAFNRINALSPSEVYAALTTEMPSPETRRYVELVLGRMRGYSSH